MAMRNHQEVALGYRKRIPEALGEGRYKDDPIFIGQAEGAGLGFAHGGSGSRNHGKAAVPG
jgi:hypothetical protein